MNLVRPMPLIAMLLMTATPAMASTQYELAHAAQALKQEFHDSYFANDNAGPEPSVGLRKSLIHVLALAVTANSVCGMGLDADGLTTTAMRLGNVESMTPQFFWDIRETVAAMAGRELKMDQAGTCQYISTLYAQSQPWIDVELHQGSAGGEYQRQ